ncbi:MAG: hypothetical protein QME60_06255 [Verrucomicrobiota bacterium]|nr:hypothetical protein [Verrucomicrobiota bacterium]
MNANRRFTVVGAVLLFAGCVTAQRIAPVIIPPARVEAQVKPTDYSIEILMLDVNKLSRKLLFSNTDGNLAAVLKDPETVVTRGHVLYVSPGTNAVMEERKVYRYPVEFDAHGQPTKHDTRTVGPMIRAGLTADKTGTLLVSVTVEDNALKRLEPIRAPGRIVCEQPVVEARKGSGTLPVEPGKWAVVSNDPIVIESKKGVASDQVWRMIVVKALPPKRK